MFSLKHQDVINAHLTGKATVADVLIVWSGIGIWIFQKVNVKTITDSDINIGRHSLILRIKINNH